MGASGPTDTATATPQDGGNAKDAQARDPFADFDFGETPTSKPTPAAPKNPCMTVEKVEEASTLSVTLGKARTCWDPSFDHPYAGALKRDGKGIFCRPCQRWIVTYGFDLKEFDVHVERVHPKPPTGWQV